MKICFLSENRVVQAGGLVPGSQVQIDRLAAEFRRRGHSVLLISGSAERRATAAKTGQGATPASAENDSAIFFRSGRRVPLFAFMRAYSLLRAHSPTVVYVRGRSYLAGVAALFARRRGTVFVWASNGEDGCDRWKSLGRTSRRRGSLLGKLPRLPLDALTDVVCDAGIDHADLHVCQTKHQVERLRAVHGREGVIVRTLQVAEHPLPDRDSPPLILWIGRVVADRQPEAFVRLAALLADEDCDFRLVGPAGSSEYLDAVLAPIAGLRRFLYVKAVPFEESWDWIARASLLINTSPVEGVSNALVQAWACGTPTLALSFDPDGLIEQSGAGLLSGSLETMADDVRRLLRDRETLAAHGARAKALAEREFSRQAVGDTYESLIERALSKEAPLGRQA